MEWIFKFTSHVDFVTSILLFLVELSNCEDMFNIPFNIQALDLRECYGLVNFNRNKSLKLTKLRADNWEYELGLIY